MTYYGKPIASYGSFGTKLQAKIHFDENGKLIKCKWCDNPVMLYSGIMRVIRDIPVPTFICIICNRQIYVGQATRQPKIKVYID